MGRVAGPNSRNPGRNCIQHGGDPHETERPKPEAHRELQSSHRRRPASAGRRHAGAIPKEEAACLLSLRLLTLSELEWDGQNPAREQGEALIRQILEAETLEEAQDAALKLKALSRPFLNWAGKAERLSFDVPTLPLFIHERLSTKAIIETLKGHKRDRQLTMFDLFGDREHSIHEQVLRAYEHRNGWVNRMILGDSLVVMNSLLDYEGLGGQVQMIYMDPPYGSSSAPTSSRLYGSGMSPTTTTTT